MVASGYDQNIEALIKLRRLEPKYRLILNPQYSEEVKGALRSLAGMSQALYEVGAANAIPTVGGWYLELNVDTGIKEDDIIRWVHECVMGLNYPAEFQYIALKTGSSIARGLMEFKDKELTLIDGEIKKSPLYPLVHQIVHLAYQYKHPEACVEGDDGLVVCAPGSVKPPPADFVNVAFLVLDDSDKIQLDRDADGEEGFDYSSA